jgi:uncharacterized protein YdhG (YjbR/CyaY superfamily)
MAQKHNTVDEYIDSQPLKTKKILKTLRSAIRKVVPQAKEILSYGVPAFNINGNLVLYAGFKSHIGFYPTPSAIEKFENELSKYNTSKGTVRFPLDEPLPLDLIVKIVEFRVQENLE